MRVKRRHVSVRRVGAFFAGALVIGIVAFGKQGAAGADEAVPTAPAVPPTTVAKPVVWTLAKAASAGLVAARGESPTSYRSVDLVLTNRSDDPLRLDLAGHHLDPTTGGCQRLGLSHPVTPSDRPPDASAGTWPIELAPREVRTIRMNTCCMDSGRACPGPADRFQLSSTPTSPTVEAALRWWTDHRDAGQGFVNYAIWSNDLKVLAQPYQREDANGTPAPIGPKGRIIRSHGGVVYTLVDGVLTSVDTEGVRRFHGTQMYDVFPRADALYAVGMSDGRYDLWRFGATGEPPWGRVFTVNPADLDVIPAVGGAYLTRSANEPLMWRSSKGHEPSPVTGGEKAARVSIGPVDASKGKYVVVTYQKGTPKAGSESLGTGALSASSSKFAVIDVNASTGWAEVRKLFWNARDMVAGPGGVFALSPVGTPERLDGEKLRRLPTTEEYESILLAGSAHLVLMTKGGRAVAFDVKTGKFVPLPESVALRSLSIDPVTDDLVWVGEHDFFRWRIGAAHVEALP